MFFGEYAALENGQLFMTVGQDSLLFPPSVMYDNQAFRLLKTYQVETPHQQQTFKEYCDRNNIETDVNLSII